MLWRVSDFGVRRVRFADLNYYEPLESHSSCWVKENRAPFLWVILAIDSSYSPRQTWGEPVGCTKLNRLTFF